MNQQSFIESQRLAKAGVNLTAPEAAALESTLGQNPQDLSARIQLLAYYELSGLSNPEGRKEFEKHILWMTVNHPEQEGLRQFSTLHPVLNPGIYPAVRQAWLDHLERQPENLEILEHAAMFFLTSERERGLDLLRKGTKLDPLNPHWWFKLGRLNSTRPKSGSSGHDFENAAQSLFYLEKAFELTPADTRSHFYGDLARAAFDSNDLEKAKVYAQHAVSPPADSEGFGNNIHNGNLVLGRIALRAGDVEEAKSRLLQSGQTPGSPNLDTFGPNMTLAKELLERGEREAVLSYFKLCGVFWTYKSQLLNEWSETVAAGGFPDFGANLRY